MKIAIGVATRERLRLLENCLKSLANIKIHPSIDLCFIIVENNDQLTIATVAKKFELTLREAGRGHVPIRVDIEPRLGIPFVRNKILHLAISDGYEFLAFLDDDEQARTDWLVELLKVQQQTGADLVGGPVWRIPDSSAILGPFQKIISCGLLQYYNKIPLREKHRIPSISTSNWLCRMHFVKEHLLQFDTSLKLTIGEDWQFDRDLTAAGGQKAWATKAIVDEVVTADRVSLRYIFIRERETRKTLYLIKEKHKKGICHAMGGILSIVLLGIFPWLILIPFDRGRSLVKVTMKTGRLLGQIEAMLIKGRAGNLYSIVTGD